MVAYGACWALVTRHQGCDVQLSAARVVLRALKHRNLVNSGEGD
jgi:hypothetical protein